MTETRGVPPKIQTLPGQYRVALHLGSFLGASLHGLLYHRLCLFLSFGSQAPALLAAAGNTTEEGTITIASVDKSSYLRGIGIDNWQSRYQQLSPFLSIAPLIERMKKGERFRQYSRLLLLSAPSRTDAYTPANEHFRGNRVWCRFLLFAVTPA
jgi:hypothetical protein